MIDTIGKNTSNNDLHDELINYNEILFYMNNIIQADINISWKNYKNKKANKTFQNYKDFVNSLKISADEYKMEYLKKKIYKLQNKKDYSKGESLLKNYLAGKYGSIHEVNFENIME